MKNREEIAQALAITGYIADGELATAISLMQLLRRPLLLEGEAGVGKTETAKALAAAHGARLIRLQCYEGLDASAALYEWNYQRQLLSIKARETSGRFDLMVSTSVRGMPASFSPKCSCVGTFGLSSAKRMTAPP